MKKSTLICNKRKLTAMLLVISFVFAMLPSFVVMANSQDVTIIREETELRTANEKHFLCSDGTMMAVAFSGDVHYLDKNGNYQNIDNTLEYNSTKGQYRSTGNPNFKVAFASSANTPGVILEDGKGNILCSVTTVETNNLSISSIDTAKLNPSNLSVTNHQKVDPIGKSRDSEDILTIPELSSSVMYQNAFGLGVSSEYIVDGNSIKENIIFNSKTNYSSIKTSYSMDGLIVEVMESGALLLNNAEGEAVFLVDAPYMFDAAGSVCPSIDVSAARVGDNWVVSYIPDAEWRNSSERVYPIVFDPFTSTATNSNITDIYNTEINGNFSQYNDDGYLKAGVEWFSTSSSNNLKYTYRTYMMPQNFPEITTDNTVVSVSLKLTKSSVVGSGDLEIYKISGNEDFANDDYSLGALVGEVSYSSSNTATTYSFDLPASEYVAEGGEYNGYVIKDSTESSNTYEAHYVTFHSSDATMASKRPKIVVTYVAGNIDDGATLLKNTVTGQYMSAATENSIEATGLFSEKSLWEFVPCGVGTFRIKSNYYEGKCIGATSSGNLTLIDVPTSNSTDKSSLWSVGCTDGQYSIVNEQYGVGLYVSGSSASNYTCRIDTGLATGVEIRKWTMSGLTVTEFSFANPSTGGFLVGNSEMNLTVLSGITKDETWRFYKDSNNGTRIVLGSDNEKFLAVDNSGNVILTTGSTASNYLWDITENEDGFSVMNIGKQGYLYVEEDSSGNMTCALDTTGTMSTTEREWKFIKYELPEVVKIRNIDLDKSIKNKEGKAYSYESIILGVDEYDRTRDKCGFRLMFDSEEDAYTISPISCCNGYYRAITSASKSMSGQSNIIEVRDKENRLKERRLFIFEMLSDGKWIIRLKYKQSLVFTGAIPDENSDDGILFLKTETSGLQNQRWEITNYQYQSPQSNIFYDYSEVNEHYKSLNFESPFHDKATDITISSDYGLRVKKTNGNLIDDIHEGIDISVDSAPLSSPTTGKVSYICNSFSSPAGKYIIIETNYYEYKGNAENGGRKIYLIYMHLQSISTAISVGTEVGVNDIVGISGASGNGELVGYGYHLHYGIFLAEKDLTDEFSDYTPWVKDNPDKSTINPLLFYNQNKTDNSINFIYYITKPQGDNQ
ncbi:MAG: hypothetical protein E7675_02355 [Ruminococcaceae bacterium]|nr:hypothetical protein [Oscillospiraceae bacterium]